MTTTPDPKKYYTKDFLTAVDDALVRCCLDKKPTTLIFRRKGQLDIRVKFDSTPPSSEQTLLVYEGP